MSSSESEFFSSCESISSEISTEDSQVDQLAHSQSDLSVECFGYDESLEPEATEEEVANHQQQLDTEEQQEEAFLRRFHGEVEVQSWCTCSNCSLELAMKSEECFCCKEMDRCMEKMEEVDMDDTCITEHPGFRNVCLDKWVLETAAIGLKTRNKKSYATLFNQGNKSEPEFLRSVAYRQIVRFIWNYMGNTMRTPLPSCIYTAIRTEFPSETGLYKGFEEENEEEQEEDEDVE